MPRPQERQIRVKTLLAWGLVLLLVGAWLVWWRWDALRGVTSDAPAVDTAEVTPAPLAEEEVVPREAEQAWTALLGTPPRWPDDLREPADCQAVQQDMLRLCRELDARPYVAARLEVGGTCDVIRQVAEQLAANPPRLSSELRDHAVMLDNVFHLFRTLGRARLQLLREILREEDELAEPLAMATYRWLVSREACDKEGSSEIKLERLYAYAGYLFQSLGGQAYLRRRSPRIEALTGFYALLILDEAAQQKQNPLGLDPRPELRRYRDLLDGEALVFGERYVRILDELSARWAAQTEQP